MLCRDLIAEDFWDHHAIDRPILGNTWSIDMSLYHSKLLTTVFENVEWHQALSPIQMSLARI